MTRARHSLPPRASARMALVTVVAFGATAATTLTYGVSNAFAADGWHSWPHWANSAFSNASSGRSSSAAATADAGNSTSGTSSSGIPTPRAIKAGHSVWPGANQVSTTPAASSATAAPTMATTLPQATTPAVSGMATRATPAAVTTKASTKTAAATNPAAPSTTASSSSAGKTNCASQPSRCGYPDSTNTGIPAGTQLQRVPQDTTSGPGWVWDSRGWVQASSGAVVKNLIVSGSINVAGSNVTVTNTRILVGGESWGVGLQHATNAVISNNEIGIAGGSPRLMTGVKDIYGDSNGTQVLHNNIVNTGTGVQVFGGVIADNYIHDMGYVSGDHTNGTTSNGSTTMLTIRHNTVFNQIDQTDAISLFQDFGVEGNRLITDNLIAGGDYAIYGGAGSMGKSFNIQITNNRISKMYFAQGGYYGAIAEFDSSGSGNAASGNYWDGDLSPINA